jgi:hypothetical protein
MSEDNAKGINSDTTVARQLLETAHRPAVQATVEDDN